MAQAQPQATFISTYQQFLQELTETFPEYTRRLEVAKNHATPREAFLSVWKPHTSNIAAQNAELFHGEGVELVPGLKMTSSLWSELSVNSQAAIWKYLTTLLLLGTAETGWDISGFQQDMDDMIKRMKAGDHAGMKQMFETFAKMAEGFGFKDLSGGLGGMFGGGGDGAEPKFKIPERLFKGHIAKIAEEIVSEFNPADFGLPPDLMESNDPAKIFTFLQEVMTQKPDMLMGIAQRIAKKIQAKFQQGSLNRDELIREAEELMKEFSENEAFSGMFEQLSEMMKMGEKESGNEGSARRREVQERLKKKAAEKAAKKAAAGVGSASSNNDAAVAAADAMANMLLMEEPPAVAKGKHMAGKRK